METSFDMDYEVSFMLRGHLVARAIQPARRLFIER